MNEALGAIAVLTAEIDLAENIMDENPTEDLDTTATTHAKKTIPMTHLIPVVAPIAPTAEVAEKADALEVAEVADAPTTGTMGYVKGQIDSKLQEKTSNGNVRKVMSTTSPKHSINSEVKQSMTTASLKRIDFQLSKN